MSGYLNGLLSLLCIDIVFAYGVFLPVTAGQLNLGGAGFQAMGAYAAAYLSANLNWPPYLTLPISALIGGAAGLAIAVPLARTRGVYMVLATIAFTEVVSGFILASPALNGAAGIAVPDFVGLNVILPITAGVVLLCFYLMSTRLGLAMRSVHDDEVVSDLMGVSVRGVQVFCFALGGCITGLSGALYAHQFGFVQAQDFDELLSVNVLLFVLLGGAQTAWGPLVGTTCFVLLPEAMRNFLPGLTSFIGHLFGAKGAVGQLDESWRFVVLGLFTVLMMIWRPQGIVTAPMLLRIQGWFAPRRRAIAP